MHGYLQNVFYLRPVNSKSHHWYYLVHNVPLLILLFHLFYIVNK